ncbi:MAG: acyl-CoA dehydrogenase family protein [Bacteriovoracia bacterium]
MSELLGNQGKNKSEIESLEVAEESRETEWQSPSFVADLFMGKVQTDAFLPYPLQEPEDKKIGDEFLRKFDAYLSKNLDGDQVDREGKIPDEVMKGLAELGAFGFKIPKEYGGLGFSQTNYNRALATVGGYCGSTAATLSAHQSIGVPQPLKLFGTPEQKKKYLPRFAKGAVSAFALTEPEVGSDPAKMSTTATPTEDGNHYIINGQKLWCTNSVIADVIVVMAQTPPKIVDGPKGKREKKQITAFIVETNTPGFEVLHRCRFMGLSGIQNGLIQFKNVKVPKENIIWGLGKGLRLALITLNTGRLSLPAVCIGGARKGLEEARKWANERVQWGVNIGKHESAAAKVAQVSADTFAMEAITWAAAAWADNGKRDIRLEAAMAKIFCSVRSDLLVDEVIQLKGGRGYENQSSLQARGERPVPLERMYRDSRINQIVEGTSEILSLFIAREALDKHLRIAGDVLNPTLPFGRRAAAFLRSAAFYSWWYPAQWISLAIWPRFAGLGKLGCHMRFVACASKKLARTTFHQMVLNGPKLERRQMQLIRLVEIATDLFAMAAVIGRAHTKQSADAKTYGNVDDVADYFCRMARVRIRQNFRAVRCNPDKQMRRLADQVLKGQSVWQENHLEI